jgi:hypothetical protein
MHGPTNVKSPNNISKWQMGFNSAFKGLIELVRKCEKLNKKYSDSVWKEKLIGKEWKKIR